MYEFRMPSLGADMEAGTLVEWLIKPGDEVQRGQVVAVVETQKGTVDVEIWEAGTVDKLVVEMGRKVPVGELLALLRTAGEPAVSATSGQEFLTKRRRARCHQCRGARVAGENNCAGGNHFGGVACLRRLHAMVLVWIANASR